jgi:hypothetical protein
VPDAMRTCCKEVSPRSLLSLGRRKEVRESCSPG